MNPVVNLKTDAKVVKKRVLFIADLLFLRFLRFHSNNIITFAVSSTKGGIPSKQALDRMPPLVLGR